jgi:prophage maintenance system killer protein
MDTNLGEIILYQSEDGSATLTVHLREETVWLTQAQMQELFSRERSVITKHINNVFKEGELDKNQVCAKFAHTASDDKTYQVNHYNLDVIISVGYRVKSQRGTQFRIWATSVLKDHLVKGYTLNRKRLAEKGLNEAKQMLALLSNTLEDHNLISDEGRSVLQIVNQYARTWKLLWQYDEDTLALPTKKQGTGTALHLETARQAILTLQQELLAKGEATDIFGNEQGDGLARIVGAIRQTFGGQDLYPSVEEKAAHLLYFMIKDHPFTDGNKRIGSFLFLCFLQINGLLYRQSFDNKALVALTLLTAASNPRQKDLLIRLIINLLTETEEGP